MKKHITSAIAIAILAGVWSTGCDDVSNNISSTTTLHTSQFDGAQGSCTNGGIKIEVLLDGAVDDTQTQYLCNGSQGGQGQGGQSGTNSTIKTTKFEGAEGGCTHGGVKIEVLVDGVVDNTQTQYICNGLAECLTDNGCRETAYCDQTTYTCIDKKELGESCTQSYQCMDGICTNDNLCGIVIFGQYEQDNDTTNGKEPIRWIVLDKNSSGQYLLVSEKVLDAKPYNTTYIDITWEKSTIRSWLNGYGASYNTVGDDYTTDNFIDAAFTATEKAKIIESNVPAHANPSSNTSPGNDTTDKIFLLSITEAINYFANITDRQAMATLYAVNNGVYAYNSETSSKCTTTDFQMNKCSAYWWLRSPGFFTNHAADVHYVGSVSNGGNEVENDYYGVRPALWVQHP